MIADLNAYYNFIASLRVPHLLQEFANLKMLGHVFVVDDAKDLAIIVRDVTRYGGSFRPEVSVVSDFRVCRGALTSRWFTGCLRVCAAPQ